MADFPFGETPETLHRRRAREAIIFGQRMPQNRGEAGLPSSFLTLTDRRASGDDRLSGHAERDGAVAPTDAVAAIAATNPGTPFNADTAARRDCPWCEPRGRHSVAAPNNINPEGL
ncbi:hypothetical protein [Shinella sp. G-2]|uniref:hypothetical protein n=1 Tax=Shinella sp. G-2 TaxID=3133141 RepID=UPI003D01BA80